MHVDVTWRSPVMMRLAIDPEPAQEEGSLPYHELRSVAQAHKTIAEPPQASPEAKLE